MDERLNWIVSVDDHLIEPPGLFVDRAPRALRDRVPHVEVIDGADTWVYDQGRQRVTIDGFTACAGKEWGTFSTGPVNYADMRPGYYDSRARVADMDADGVWASLCFPTVVRIAGQMFMFGQDKQLGLECARMYNDWVVEEWAGAAPGRFIPMIVLPWWDRDACVTEVERMAGKGARAVSWSENLHDLGLPSIHDDGGHWDPVLAALDETGMVLATHFGSSGKHVQTSPDAPRPVSATLVPMNLACALADFIWSGKLQRFPNLRIVLAEGGVGWIPYVLERMTSVFNRYKWARENDFQIDLMTGAVTARDHAKLRVDTEPVELFRRHVFGCFVGDQDEFGSQHLREIGIDNVMVESDYPHSDGSFPHTRQMLETRLAGYTPDERYQVLAGNALRVFAFQPAAYPTAPSAAATT